MVLDVGMPIASWTIVSAVFQFTHPERAAQSATNAVNNFLNYPMADEEFISHYYIPVSAAELNQNKTRIIQIQPEAGKQGVTTLPMDLGKPKDAETKVKAEGCLLPKMIGPCKMSRPSFYYDTDKGDCLSFLYGGCRVNG